jgi:hypothetical protein
LACILDLELDDVPNFGEHYGDIPAFFKAEKEFLTSQGLASIHIAYQGDLENVLAAMAVNNPNVIYILGGVSARGFNHSVVACGGYILHDPYEGGGGLVGPCTDSYYWVQYFTPKAFEYHESSN